MNAVAEELLEIKGTLKVISPSLKMVW